MRHFEGAILTPAQLLLQDSARSDAEIVVACADLLRRRVVVTAR